MPGRSGLRVKPCGLGSDLYIALNASIFGAQKSPKNIHFYMTFFWEVRIFKV
jgi:hypothetical protein